MPSHADGRLGEIVLKACAFEPRDRYSSPGQMRQELEAILYNKEEGKYIYPDGDEIRQDSIHSSKGDDEPPIRDEGTVSDFDGDRARDEKRVQQDGENRVRPTPEKAPRKKGIGKLAGIAVGLLVVCVARIALLSQGGGSETAHPGRDTTVSGGVPASGTAGDTYRVAVVGPEEFAFIDEIRTSLETQLNEKAIAVGSTVQVEQVAYGALLPHDFRPGAYCVRPLAAQWQGYHPPACSGAARRCCVLCRRGVRFGSENDRRIHSSICTANEKKERLFHAQ